MTQERTAFTADGAIERGFGKRNREIRAKAYGRDRIVVHHDFAVSTEARSNDWLNSFDDTMTTTLEGDLWVSFLERSTDEKDPKGTLVEHWEKYDGKDGPVAFVAIHTLSGIAKKHATGGEEREKHLEIRELGNYLSDRLQSGRLSSDDKTKLGNEVREKVIELKYPKSRLSYRRKIADKFIRATQDDRTGRPNQPAGRVIVASTQEDIKIDIHVDDIIALKNMHRASEIDSECDYEDLALSQFSQVARELSASNDFEKEWDNIKGSLRYLVSPRETLRLKPYSQIGAKLRFGLFATGEGAGTNNDAVYILGKYIGLKEAVEFAKEFSFFNDPTLNRPERAKALAELCDVELAKIRETRKNFQLPLKPARTNLWDDLNSRYGHIDWSVQNIEKHDES